MTVNKASARYEGLGKDGKGHIWTESKALDAQPYGFNTRFEDEPGTNPEELIGAAHASCFTMATSFGLAKAGYEQGQLDTDCAVTLEKDGDGFTVTKSALTLVGRVPDIDHEEFEKIADEAKRNCPLSKLLDCEITLDITLKD
ncbi:OsmC family protein [Sphingomicrobium sp. XHP0239]|uniref:OsmC family protein n=1 Tax=Sphingomicrobium maritimum TaxID=3133972 RepID=UPI0031CC96E0